MMLRGQVPRPQLHRCVVDKPALFDLKYDATRRAPELLHEERHTEPQSCFAESSTEGIRVSPKSSVIEYAFYACELEDNQTRGVQVPRVLVEPNLRSQP